MGKNHSFYSTTDSDSISAFLAVLLFVRVVDGLAHWAESLDTLG